MSVRDNEVYWDSLVRIAYNTIDKHIDSLGAVLLERLNVNRFTTQVWFTDISGRVRRWIKE